ncbi:MAG: methylated-DNA--[protein]-cysteine S-methyltransferase [Rubrivivax sp.]|nr:MAG: methylated-DNA--[protein]-cysteine S-methyltransferase [Rubrivivax sp.]
MAPLTFLIDTLPTVTGPMLLVTDEHGRLRAADWQDHESRLLRLLRLHYGEAVRLVDIQGAQPSPARAAFEAYFGGDLTAIENVPVETAGTAFQREVWAALRTIPAGQTLSYGALAARLNRPQAMRAVGLANGANPVSIVVPCHRVIGAKGALTGYGGGVARKRWLLAHESPLSLFAAEAASAAP